MTTDEFTARRKAMLDYQIRDRGITAPSVLAAMGQVRREAFVPDDLRELAYSDSPLPIAAGQTISQPMIVAMMLDALDLQGGERVLDVGTGSGYAAAVLACIAQKVYSIERIAELATTAQKVLQAEGFTHVEVRIGDGSLGWPEAAPFDAINVAAGAPVVPEALKQQLAIGGRLVLPVGPEHAGQQLLRVTRLGQDSFKTEQLAAVRFVPLIGEAGWKAEDSHSSAAASRLLLSAEDQSLVERIAEQAEAFEAVDELPLAGLLKRIGDSRLVLLGESTHGTSEFYRARQRITRALIEEQGFDFVAIEGDWPDVARLNDYVQHTERPLARWTAFERFPAWMWRNQEMQGFVDWLREHNAGLKPEARIALHGLDLYNPYQSIAAVLAYLDEIDPELAVFARERYACVASFKSEPANYGRWLGSPGFPYCEAAVQDVLHALQAREHQYAEQGRERFFNALQNARLVVSAEAYYRLMYDEGYNTWNLRDTHMFDTLEALFAYYGEGSRGVVWAHNSHIGDARATQRAQYGELNLGQLCRERLADKAYLIGFGTNRGTLAAAADWGEAVAIKSLNPVLAESYEYLCHASGHAGFLLPLGQGADPEVRQALLKPRLQRGIGVIYRPDTERDSHYCATTLARQFDEYIWLERSRAVTLLDAAELEKMPDKSPFAL